jgi:hypothetical protein
MGLGLANRELWIKSHLTHTLIDLMVLSLT